MPLDIEAIFLKSKRNFQAKVHQLEQEEQARKELLKSGKEFLEHYMHRLIYDFKLILSNDGAECSVVKYYDKNHILNQRPCLALIYDGLNKFGENGAFEILCCSDGTNISIDVKTPNSDGDPLVLELGPVSADDIDGIFEEAVELASCAYFGVHPAIWHVGPGH